MVANSSSKNDIDLFIVCDTTGSMGSYVQSLSATICQVFALTELLFNGRLKLHVVSYKDYCDGNSVLTSCNQRTLSNEEIIQFAKMLRPSGGGDYPEAVKTALNHVIMTVDEIRATASSNAIVFIYTDAPPHCASTNSSNMKAEIKAIDNNPKYRGGHDWLSIKSTLQEMQIPVFTFHTRLYNIESSLGSAVFYGLLGPVVLLTSRTTTCITKGTIGLLLQLMKQPFEYANQFEITSISQGTTKLDPSFTANSETQIPNTKTLSGTSEPFMFDALEWMVEDLSELPTQFRTNVDFQNLVYKTFDMIFTPENVLALTYNSVLAKLWRLVCGRRLDERLVTLSTKLSQCVPALAGDEKKQVQDWIEESYNNSAMIQEAIEKVDNSPCYILETSSAVIDKDDLRSLARAPNPGAYRSVQSLLTHLQYSTTPGLKTEDGIPLYLPIALTDTQIFSYLPHLLFPGTTFSQKGAAIMAILCCLSDNTLLKPRAEAFLASIQGKWLPFENITEFPELLSLEFIKLLYRAQAYLSAEEAQIYSRLYQLFRMRLAASKEIELSIAFVPKKEEIRPDYKTKCSSCGYPTSLSLMVTPTQCALCFNFEKDEAMKIQQEHQVDENQSHLVECRGCHAIYAVIQHELLTITPKCFYCRTLAPERPELFECRGCLNKFVDPSGLYHEQCGDRCAVCAVTPDKTTTVKRLPFQNIITANPHVATALGWTQESTLNDFIAMVFNRQLNYFKMYTQSYDLVFSAGTVSMNGLKFTIDGKEVHATEALCNEINRILLLDSLKDVCNLCFEELTLPALESACGSCSTRVCSPCLTRWYGENQPGKLVLTANLSCAFCRRDPKLKVLRKFNRLACGLVFTSGKPQIRPDMYYGWCIGCYQVKEMVERTCTREPPYEVTAFQCAECIEAQRLRDLQLSEVHEVAKNPADTQKCPGCHVPTEKTGGCNHITCVCGQHWCFVCTKGFDSDESVYDHLYEVHRGVY